MLRVLLGLHQVCSEPIRHKVTKKLEGHLADFNVENYRRQCNKISNLLIKIFPRIFQLILETIQHCLVFPLSH